MHPPRSSLVRAVSILTGYFIKPTGPNSCTFIYLSQADPKGKTITNAILFSLFENCCIFRVFFFKQSFISFASGSLPKVVVNGASQILAPKVCKVTRVSERFVYFIVNSCTESDV